MRFAFPIVLTIATLFLSAVLFLPWQQRVKDGRDGWVAAYNMNFLHEQLDVDIPYYLVLILVGLAMVASWLRLWKYPKYLGWIAVALLGLACCHMVMVVWHIETGYPDRYFRPMPNDDDFTIQMPLAR